LLQLACNNSDSPNKNEETTTNASTSIGYVVTQSFAHDTTSFTEGFLVHQGTLYESTGSPPEMSQTRSIIGPVDLKTGVINKKIELDREKYFGEGIVFLNNKIYQLTYQTKKGFVYDQKNFRKIGEFTYHSKEGWGMTTDGINLIMSDGTSTLTYLDPNSFQPVKTISVTNENGPVKKLNELEFIRGFIYANVYTTSTIIKIDPQTGKEAGKLDLSSLAAEAKIKYSSSLEMNGIAYDSASRKVYVTGKLWPNIYEIEFNH
jgi:glutamine cyclotransferase